MAAPWTVRRDRKPGRRRIDKRPQLSGSPVRSRGDYSTPPGFDADTYPVTADEDFELVGQALPNGSAATATATRTANLDADFDLEADLAADLEADLQADLEADSDLDFEDQPPDVLPFTSYLDAEPPSSIRSRRQAAGPGTRGQAGSRRIRRRVALPLLALLVVASLALTGTIVGLANLGLSAARPSPAGTGELVVPAPALAGGLPRHYRPVTDTVTQALINEFARRFTTITGSAGRPAALYREPGTIDIATDQPGWVMYLGFNATGSLGAPSATVARVIAKLIGDSAPGSSWVAAPGPRGGSARCAIAPFGKITVSLCAWATKRTIGALMSPTADTRGNELANVLMPQMRLDLQPASAP